MVTVYLIFEILIFVFISILKCKYYRTYNVTVDLRGLGIEEAVNKLIQIDRTKPN